MSRANVVDQIEAWYRWATDPNVEGTDPPEGLQAVAAAMHNTPAHFRGALDARHKDHRGKSDRQLAADAGYSLSQYKRRIAMGYAWVDGFISGRAS